MSDMSKYIKKSDIKCPICQTVLDVTIMSDKVLGCPKCRNMGNIDLWKELIKLMEENKRTRKALDVAKDAIDKILYLDSGKFIQEPAEMWKIAKSAKDKITAPEQKDVK